MDVLSSLRRQLSYILC